MKKLSYFILLCLLLIACNNSPNDLSVKGHTYYAEFHSQISDDTEFNASATISFDDKSCYLNEEFAGNYKQEKEVVYVYKVENYSGTQLLIGTDRVYTSYGDYITFGGVVYNKIK